MAIDKDGEVKKAAAKHVDMQRHLAYLQVSVQLAYPSESCATCPSPLHRSALSCCNVHSLLCFVCQQSVDAAVDSEIRALTTKRAYAKLAPSPDLLLSSSPPPLPSNRSLLHGDRVTNALNTEVMLKVKQGQVEVEEAPVVTDLK